MKITKMIKGALAAMLLATGLNAGVAEEQQDGITFNKLFIDLGTKENQLEFFELANYSYRQGITVDSRVSNIMRGFNDYVYFKITAKILIPAEWKAKKVMIQSTSDNIRKNRGNSSAFFINKIINGKSQKGKNFTLTVNTDNFGNQYAEFILKGRYVSTNDQYVQWFKNSLSTFKFKVANAKKKRGQDYAWMSAKFFVTEE